MFFLDPVAQTTSMVAGAGSDDQPIIGSNDGAIAQANASVEVAKAQSGAQVQIATQNAAVSMLGINKSSQDAQFQTLAWLTERLDSHDVKMQIAVENAKISYLQESDRHAERMEGLKLDARELEIEAADRAREKGVSTAMSS